MRNVNISIVNFSVLPITKNFIFRVENLEARDERFEVGQTASLIPPPRATCGHDAITYGITHHTHKHTGTHACTLHPTHTRALLLGVN